MSASLALTPDNQQIPKCCNCSTSTTPLWRRDEVGSVLCNACGLFLKLHGRPRPISLKTDVIKSRNRVKTSGQGTKKKAATENNGNHGGRMNAASVATGFAQQAKALIHHDAPKGAPGHSERSTSPLSRTGTPGLGHHPSNIAPQHVFDGVTLNGHEFQSASLPSFMPPRQPSPSASSMNGSHGVEPPMSYDHHTTLRTRVSELEVINDLFRGRVTELEQSERAARDNEARALDNEKQMQNQLEEAHIREAELKRRVEELESELAEYKSEGPRQKKMRLSDIVDESAASTPASTASQSN
ncbi:GATA transcription factor [Phyllosticta capitalensis]|uniref:GATA transcription factor n=1 Tax=Phyllosticta capitalensis TaxID=121624 RepID=A0ABR1YA45_9PEZI